MNKVYEDNQASINPNNLPRGLHEYHVDHVVSVSTCFKLNIHPDIANSVYNLQMLPAKDNLAKSWINQQEDVAIIDRLILESRNMPDWKS